MGENILERTSEPFDFQGVLASAVPDSLKALVLESPSHSHPQKRAAHSLLAL